MKIFVLTDGEDNCSTKYDANSIVQLTKSIVGGNSKFDFIQVGKGGNAGIVSALKTLNTATGNNAFRSMVVDDSAKGIRSVSWLTILGLETSIYCVMKNVDKCFWVAYLTRVKLNLSRIRKRWVVLKLTFFLMTQYMDVPKCYSFCH